MTKPVALLIAFITSTALIAQSPQPLTPQTVDVPNDTLHLKGLLWKPAGPGPFPAVMFNHGRSNTPQQHTRRLTITEAAQVLGPVFARHGYVFLYLFRRGEGLSAQQAPFIGDLLEQEQKANGDEARKHLQLLLMTTDHLSDALAGLAFLKTVPGVDPKRVAVAGHSFGGQLTLFAAERDTTLRAAVAFAPAANSWEGSPELRERLLATVDRLTVPVLFLQAANDYSLAPTQAMSDEMLRLKKPHDRKIYAAEGETANDGHNFLYTDVDRWEKDVFAFLDKHVKR